MEVNNPYLKKIRELFLELDKEENPEKMEELQRLQEKSRAWTQEKLKEIQEKSYVQSEKIVEVKEDKSMYPSLSRQYKQACSTYRDIMQIVDEIRALKKDLREEIQAKKEAKKSGG